MYNKKQKISTVFENFGKGNPRIKTKTQKANRNFIFF